MTLARKIVLRNMALLLGLLLLGAASIAALLAVLGNVRVIMKEYAELRMIENTTFHVSTASIMTLSRSGSAAEIDWQLELASSTLEAFQKAHLNFEPSHEPDEHDRSEIAAIDFSQEHLTDLRQAIEKGSLPDTPEELQRWVDDLNAILNRVSVLSHEADELVAEMQLDAQEAVWAALATVTILFGVIAMGSIVIGVKQYRAVIGPLGVMRNSVRRIAAGEFSERLGSLGDSEFNELAQDFNRMSAQLDELYRNLERKVAQKSRELVASERLASVGYLAAGVAHEINNPLNIISGFAELSLKRLGEEASINGNGTANNPAVGNPAAPGDDDAIRTLQIIRDEAFRCKEITGRLLSLSRPGGGRRVPVSIADVVRVVAELVSGHHVSEGRRVEIDLNGDVLLVSADDTELKQVMLNLTVNALQAVNAETGVVHLHAHREGQSIEIHVTDNGRGMSPETIERIFEPFYTLGAPGSSRGVGLGLSISRAIIAAHQGSIRAESDGSGRGSRFVVTLPALTDTKISSVAVASGS